MTKKFILPIIIALALVFIGPANCYPQDEGTVYEPTAGNFFVVGARALAMGGAHIAVASDATALIYNPAGLARVSRIEFAGGLTHQSADNSTSWQVIGQPYDGPSQNNTRFSSANIVMPVPTYRGSLVLALGVNRVHSFDRTMDYQYVPAVGSIETGAESESGGLYLWSLGGAVDLSPNVSVGAAFNLWSGKNNYTWFYETQPVYYLDSGTRYDDIIKDRYSGLNGKFGFRIQPNRFFVVGGTIDTPVTLTIKEDWEYYTEDPDKTTYDYGSSEYKVSLPFSMGAGVAFYVDQFTLAGDINYTDWTQMEYKKLENEGEANRQIKRTYTDAIRFHLGAEYLIPQISTSLRAGFYRDPLPFRADLVKKDRSFFTAGIGFLIDQVMTLDIAWAHGSWEIQNFPTLGMIEKYTADRLFVSFAYRL
jgi:hypothetical protein